VTALRHQKPDRVPIDWGGGTTGIGAEAYDRLKTLLGFEGPTRTFVRDHAEIDEVILQRFGVDTRYVRVGAPRAHRFELAPEIYRRMIKPAQKRVWAFIKSRTTAQLFLHSCGAVRAFIPDLIEIGVDILNPVQVAAKGMDPGELKVEFGKDLTFWGGGCDTQKVLTFGTPREVEAEVRRRISELAPGGGFVFNQIHNVQPQVPAENIIRMLDTVLEYGRYPIRG
jgi:hypothetical protein